MIDYPLESFVFYRSFRDAIEEMNDENKLATLLAICDYALYGVEPKLKDAMSRAVFTVARPSIDANKAKRKNGKMGGRPPKETSGLKNKNHRFLKSESTETETGTETGTKADKPSRSRFVPPTVDDIRGYCLEQGNNVDPEQFFDYYSANGWVQGKGKPIKDWKAAVRTWARRDGGTSKQETTATPRVTYHTEIIDGEEVDVLDA